MDFTHNKKNRHQNLFFAQTPSFHTHQHEIRDEKKKQSTKINAHASQIKIIYGSNKTYSGVEISTK